MVTPTRNVDRRIQRTRQSLQQAFTELMWEKQFREITIQDITERANVNRGTFYAHFPDKYALLEVNASEDFRHTLTRKLPPTAKWGEKALHRLIQEVLEYFKNVYRQCPPSEGLGPLLEQAMHRELVALLLKWLRQNREAQHWSVAPETIASIMGWTILGAANQWSQGITTLSSDQMADDVLLVIMGGVTPLIPTP